ncbi:MAG TPA: hypothetical protein VIV27_00375 [Halioglobus sp.]|jgi:hypothetical protein
MTSKTTSLDPQMQIVAKQISQAFKGGTDSVKGFNVTSSSTDAAQMAAAFLSAYHQAVLVNPGKALKSKGVVPPVRLEDPESIVSKGWFDDFVKIVGTVGPLVINLASKDYKPDQPDLKSVIARVPDARRDDQEWIDFASQWLLVGAQTCIQTLSGSKDFSDPKNLPELPQPPAGADKGWFDDIVEFVADAAPVVMPIVLSLI